MLTKQFFMIGGAVTIDTIAPIVPILTSRIHLNKVKTKKHKKCYTILCILAGTGKNN